MMKVGIFQCAGGDLSPSARISKLEDYLKGQDLDLVVCPELFMSGYNVGDQLPSLAEPQTGSFAQKISSLAMQYKVAVTYGYPEIVDEKLFNAAICISAEGDILANHRKLLLPPGFESDYFSSGSDLTLFDLGGLRCAILICYDAEFPETVRAVAEAGAQVVIVPTALVDAWGNVANQVMPTRAFENGVWLIYANHAGREGNLNYLGESCIVAPNGSDAARAGTDETLIMADLCEDKVKAAQARLPYLKKLGQLRAVLD